MQGDPAEARFRARREASISLPSSLFAANRRSEGDALKIVLKAVSIPIRFLPSPTGAAPGNAGDA